VAAQEFGRRHRRAAGRLKPLDGNRSVAAGNQQVGRRADIQEALSLIRRRACEGATIGDVAAELNMLMRTFQVQFAAVLGHPVGEELRRARLERAAELLVDTDLSLTSIANQSGYSDSACLTKLSRRTFGQTPSHIPRRAAPAIDDAAKATACWPSAPRGAPLAIAGSDHRRSG